MERPIELTLTVHLGEDADLEEVDAAVQSLFADLLEAPVAVRRPPPDAAPPGSKGAGGVAVDVLMIAGQAFALEVAVEFIKEWLQRWRTARIGLKAPDGTDVVVLEPGLSAAGARELIGRLSGQALA